MKKYRKRLSFRVKLLIVFGIALAVAAAILLAVYLSGFRYITCHRLNGTDVRFVGMVDKAGKLSSGRIY